MRAVQLSALILAVSSAACRAPPRSEEAAARRLERAAAPRASAEASQEPAVRVNRTLVYPVRHGRAEDLAVTLEPLLVAMYGPGVRVVPHVHTNRLLIYVPPREEREMVRQGPAGQPAAGAAAGAGAGLRRAGRRAGRQ
ncbi:MAG: hypothetical protein HY721_29215 [Planctomycetes bacterium]|nr:hypothetical protein [Planctomycetota bacterium]